MDTVSASKVSSGHDNLAGDRNDAPANVLTAELMRGSISSPGITGLPHREGMHTFRKFKRDVETADDHVARRLTIGYILVSSGTCQSNNGYELTQADCGMVAAYGLHEDGPPITPTYWPVQTWDNVANGCIHSSSQDITAFVINSHMLLCGSNGYDCICAFDHSNAGSASLLFLMYPHHVLDCFF